MINSRTPLFVSIVFIHGLRFSSACKVDDRFLRLFGRSDFCRDENDSIPHDFVGKFGSATVMLKRAPEGTGVIAGGPARAVMEKAGIRNIRTKSLGSNNKHNVVLAAIEGLTSMYTPEEIARLRGKSVEEILG